MPIEIKVFGSGLCTRAKFFFSKCNLSSDGYRIGKNAIYDKNAIYEYVAKFILNYVIDCIFLPYLKPRFHRNAFFVPCHKPRFHRNAFFFTLSQARISQIAFFFDLVSTLYSRGCFFSPCLKVRIHRLHFFHLVSSLDFKGCSNALFTSFYVTFHAT